jgi:DNA-binding Lrp family transcriptional regulator
MKASDDQIIDFIVETNKRGWPPSITEIGEEVGLSRTQTHARLVELEQKGRIKRVVSGGITRGIEVDDGV